MTSLQNSAPLWNAVTARDARFSGVFVYAVRTTGVFCRPGCPSRAPRRENVEFFAAPVDAAAAGFRPCKRCQPTREDTAVAVPIVSICRDLEREDKPLSLAEIADRFGWTSGHLQKTFKKALGVTPKQYADAVRIERLKSSLGQGQSVGAATYDAGFGSSSRLYERARHQLGMTPAAYRDKGAGQDIHYWVAQYPLGAVLAAATDKGVCSLKFGEPAQLEAQLNAEFANAKLSKSKRELKTVLHALDAYFARDDHAGADTIASVPIDIAMTAFQALVWRVLRDIPSGQTLTYAEVAAAIGRPRAYRAVARACAANPVALLIPCHRVVGKSGLGGYRWGVERKEALLARERASTHDDG